MNWFVSRWLLLMAALVAVVGLPITRTWLTRDAAPRCAWDGLPIEPLYRVRVVDADGAAHPFCCVRCAEKWLARQKVATTRSVYVQDEATGVELNHGEATYVISPVATNRINGNRIRVFREREAAEEHLRAFGGRLLDGVDRPFAAVRR
jgi:hypothetical protein